MAFNDVMKYGYIFKSPKLYNNQTVVFRDYRAIIANWYTTDYLQEIIAEHVKQNLYRHINFIYRDNPRLHTEFYITTSSKKLPSLIADILSAVENC